MLDFPNRRAEASGGSYAGLREAPHKEAEGTLTAVRGEVFDERIMEKARLAPYPQRQRDSQFRYRSQPSSVGVSCQYLIIPFTTR